MKIWSGVELVETPNPKATSTSSVAGCNQEYIFSGTELVEAPNPKATSAGSVAGAFAKLNDLGR